MPYAADRVAFHGYKIYELIDGKYKEVDDVEGPVDDIYKAAEGIDAAKPRPNLVIKSVEEGIKFAEMMLLLKNGRKEDIRNLLLNSVKKMMIFLIECVMMINQLKQQN